MPIIQLNDDFIENDLICPEGNARIEFVSDDRSGLYVLVSGASPGVGTYFLRTKINGKTTHIKIGRTTDVDLATAREMVKKLRAQITLGEDPTAKTKSRKELLTFTDFFTDHYLPFAKQRKRSWKRDQELFELRLKKTFGTLKLNQITRAQIQNFHTGMRNEGLAGATCDHQVKLLRHCLNMAVEWGLLEVNPAAGFKLFNEPNNVENYLDEKQLQKLLHILRTHKNRAVCNIALWLLSTGARLNEALQARWDHIDLENRVWRIPSANSKSKKVRAVPLNNSAIEVLDSLTTEGTFDYLFVNRRTKKPYTTIHKVWSGIRKEAGLPHLRIHDLRHSYASILVNSGRSLYEVQQILGHSQPQVTQRYSHLSTKTLQEAAATASDAIADAMKSS